MRFASMFESGRTGLIRFLIASLLLLPTFAFAAGGENVKLEFSDTDKLYLYISLVFGAIAIATAFLLRSWVVKQSAGNEKMQEVGGAIHAGALAYLKKQISTMAIFVVVLALVLFGIYYASFGMSIAALTSVCFILGVAASYIAGYVGMDMAVRANMRTAAAALTSYSKSLQIAFRSGAVAGLITVGMGLIGATAIFLVFPADSMKLLVGFGFGGSLAALFMRVGGGIFTKAADVGADLVGKVEAGIPEDDPRNPAVIADNVGDNVGDCAGMAADVFESYEVTLVAAIVLGAATAAIFDTNTWMRLIMFALMARGVGILASIIGIFMVKGSDDINSDPLKAIRRGFFSSAVIAAIATAVVAFVMMGGMNKSETIKTNQLISKSESLSEEMLTIIQKRNEKAKEKKVLPVLISARDLEDDAELTKMIPDEDMRRSSIGQALAARPESIVSPHKWEGYTKLDLKGHSPVLNYAINAPSDPQNPFAAPTYVSIKEGLSSETDPYIMAMLELVSPAQPGPDGKPMGEGVTRTVPYGPIKKSELDEQIQQFNASGGGGSVKILGEPSAVSFYANADGDVIYAASSNGGKIRPHDLPADEMNPLAFYKVSVDEMKKLEEARTKEMGELNTKNEELMKKRDELEKAGKKEEAAAVTKEISELAPTVSLPAPTKMGAAVVTHNDVPWWSFLLCIGFGIVMAFIFEFLTDYYVSLHKKPVQEVASVATAGPAPMIITGFAYGKESSVFSVFAIVLCLIAPLLIFNPNVYGSYLLSFYGIALVGLGLLTTTGFILAMDTFGPISDNAQGVFEMSGAGHDNPEGARAVQLLDAAGNTTKALTKGFAIATAVVAAVALFHAFVEEGKLTTVGMSLDVPEIFLGLLLGGAAPYLFSAFSINAVGRAAFELINEVRRQFRNDPGIMAGTSKPDYGRCVEISTAAAQKELLGPGILAIAFPILVAFGFSIGKAPTIIGGESYNLTGAQALGGFLVGTILSGQLMAVLLANSGGLWDNAKKLIEDGLHGGKGTEAHKAAVVCDTVGDPFKDTAGPALNPLIKVMNLVALLIAPQVIRPLGDGVLIAITVAAAVALLIAIWWSKRGSMGDMMTAAAAEAAAEGKAPVQE